MFVVCAVGDIRLQTFIGMLGKNVILRIYIILNKF